MDDLYGGAYHVFDTLLSKSGIEREIIDITDVTVLHKYIRKNTKVRKRYSLRA